MKRRVYSVTFRKEDDVVVRPIIDNFRIDRDNRRAGIGMFKSGIIYNDGERGYWTVTFEAFKSALNIELLERSLLRLDELNIVVWKEVK